MFNKFIAFFLALSSLIFQSGASFKVSKPERYTDAVTAQCDYLLSLSQADGSLPMTLPDAVDSTLSKYDLPDWNGTSSSVYSKWRTAKICPYFSCIAAIGLIDSCPDKAKETAEKYISWHFAHLNSADTDYSGVAGTIFDYKIFVNPLDKSEYVCIPSAELYSDKSLAYDSTDSYGAMFLKLLGTYCKAYPESDFLNTYRDETDFVVASISATYVPSLGLTYAKPDYKFCYLMDNCEVYEGLKSACALYSEVFCDEAYSETLAEFAENIKAGIQANMYSATSRAYYSSVTADGKKSASVMPWALEEFYPNATSQLFPIICGVIDSNSFRAHCIYERFNLNFGTKKDGKSWQTLSVGASFPWAVIARASVMMKDEQRTEQFFDAVSAKYQQNGFKYPYYCAEAGHLLTAAAMIEL